MDAIGQIRNRFSFNDIDHERIKRNIEEYNFGIINSKKEYIKVNYKQINKKTRNFVMHVDKKDECLIKDKIYYGTFNVIYKGMNLNTKKDLLNPLKKQNNLLNLINKTYTVYSHYDKTNSGKNKYRDYEINLLELKKDLLKLKETNDKIYRHLNDKLFA